MNKKIVLPALFKYLLPMLVYISSAFWIRSMSYMFFGVLEILLVAIMTELSLRTLKKGERIIYILNSLVMLMINVQAVCLFFARSLLTFTILTNLDSFRNPSGNALQYIIGIIIVLILSFLPVTSLRRVFRLRFQRILSIILAFEIILVMAAGNNPSPLWGYISVAKSAKAVMGLTRNPKESKDSSKMFFKPVALSLAWVEKPDSLRDHPNIILIFTEGLSQSIVDDKRDIMPSIRKYEQSGLCFDNYYNHTFGESKGIEGTLFSGYQLSSNDTNGLSSIQGILSKNEYYTEFINTQPSNRKFTSFLETLGFDSVKSPESGQSSPRNLLSDQEAYERLFDEALLLSENNSPFMLGILTSGTHISSDSAGKKFGNGSNPLLNRFYDSDFQFNEFMNKFNDSKLADNTMIVFTSNQATYAEREFTKAFPDCIREAPDVDEIPFFIYYKGIQPQVIDAAGRNSLDFTSTVLDYIDVAEPNYFLGETLFYSKENNTNYDTIFWDSSVILSTDDGIITDISENERLLFMDQMREYFNAMKYDSVKDEQ